MTFFFCDALFGVWFVYCKNAGEKYIRQSEEITWEENGGTMKPRDNQKATD